MGWDGLNKKALAASFVVQKALSASEKSLYKATQTGKEAELAAKILSRTIKKLMDEKDFSTLLELERQQIKADISIYGGEEKRMNALAGLDQTERLLRATSSVEGAKEYLLSLNGGTLPKSIPSSDMVQRFIKNHKVQLTQMIDATASPALKFNRVQRKAALDLIKKEYEKNLNLALGRTAPERSMGREL